MTYGVTAIKGTYGSGKTSLIPLIAFSLLQADSVVKEQKEEAKAAGKKFTIQELLNHVDSDSDEDMYDTTKDTDRAFKNQFPWHQQGYQSVFDENEGLINNKN